ncbi:MAG: AarF/UbiB family protein, partial [Bacteroidota bacterium]
SVEITESCSHLKNIVFPKYYPDYSNERILTMDWIEGRHITEWMKSNPTEEERNTIGQALWDFYDYQIHTLKTVHADPHPGNFIITEDNKLGIIDFGCVKVIPEEFYEQYFQLLRVDILDNTFDLEGLFHQLGFLSDNDTNEEKQFFMKIFKEMIELLGRPFRTERFDFGDDQYFKEIYEVGDRVSRMKEIRNSKTARGNKHGLYVNRTYFGLYNLLNELKSNVDTSKPID